MDFNERIDAGIKELDRLQTLHDSKYYYMFRCMRDALTAMRIPECQHEWNIKCENGSIYALSNAVCIKCGQIGGLQKEDNLTVTGVVWRKCENEHRGILHREMNCPFCMFKIEAAEKMEACYNDLFKKED